jgi:hypothetical protein
MNASKRDILTTKEIEFLSVIEEVSPERRLHLYLGTKTPCSEIVESQFFC